MALPETTIAELKALKARLEEEGEESEEKTSRLLDAILGIALNPRPAILVGHRFPDDDTWLCFWMAQKFLMPGAEVRYIFVNAGESLSVPEGNGDVYHFDTGGGLFDQHGKGIKKTSSASIFAKELGLLEEHPGLKPLLAMVDAVDNVDPLPPTSLHFVIEGLPRHSGYRQTDGTVNWQMVQKRVFESFDIIYGQETQRIQGRINLEKHVKWPILPNSLKVAVLLGHPELRDAAYEKGAAVVIWTTPQKKFYTGIQVSRKYPDLRLTAVAESLRIAEAGKRRIDVFGKNLSYIGRGEPAPQWFLHDSLKLVLNGSRSWQLEDDEYTLLEPEWIVKFVIAALSKITRVTVDQWQEAGK